MRALQRLRDGERVGDQAMLIACTRQGFGDKGQWLAVERNGATALPWLNLEGQRRDGEWLRHLRGDLVGVAQAEEGLAVLLFVQVLCFATGWRHHRAGQFQRGQDWRCGVPGVHQQVHLHAQRAAHYHAGFRYQAALYPHFWRCAGKQWRTRQ
ncbi:hypothetical protein D3C80_1132970 [compost metagenome]